MRPLLGPPLDPASTYHRRRFQDVSEAVGESTIGLRSEASGALSGQSLSLRLDKKRTALWSTIV